MIPYKRERSKVLVAIGPICATLQHNGNAPCSLTLLYVGFNPKTPQNEAGMRIEPPPSAPIAAEQSPKARVAAEPLELPPVSCYG